MQPAGAADPGHCLGEAAQPHSRAGHRRGHELGAAQHRQARGRGGFQDRTAAGAAQGRVQQPLAADYHPVPRGVGELEQAEQPTGRGAEAERRQNTRAGGSSGEAALRGLDEPSEQPAGQIDPAGQHNGSLAVHYFPAEQPGAALPKSPHRTAQPRARE